jgi:hypothetical protein
LRLNFGRWTCHEHVLQARGILSMKQIEFAGRQQLLGNTAAKTAAARS